MTILGVDLSSNNPVFDFALAFQQGVRACYVKLGGDNIPRYVSSSYAGRIDQVRAHKMIAGHYWVTGGHDPEAAARFFVANLRNPQPGDFFVLDNEKLDDGNMYSDAEAARWIATVQRLVGGDPRRVYMYASGYPMGASTWPLTRATGAQALVAWYDRAPFDIPQPLGAWPADQIGGHQFTSSAQLGGGARIDANAFKDTALTFTGTAADTPQEDDVPNVYEIITGSAISTDKASGTFYVSINRAQRYPLPNMSIVNDYQYFMRNELGYNDAQLATKVVDHLEAFGPIVLSDTTDVVPTIDYGKLAEALKAALPDAAGGLTQDQIKAAFIDALHGVAFEVTPSDK